MKKFVFLLIVAGLTAGTVFAQRGWGGGWAAPVQTTTVSGTLGLQNGVIVVASGDTTYYVPALMRYAGFIPGLTEGAQISIDGFVMVNNFQPAASAAIRPTAFTVGGKTYDLAAASQGLPGGAGFDRGGFNRGGRFGGGRGNCCR